MNLNKISIERLKFCDPKLQVLAHKAIINAPYRFSITCGHRPIEDQKKLFAQGRTTPGAIVTNADGINDLSPHNYLPSKAFDFFVINSGQITWKKEFYIEMGEYFKKVAGDLKIKIEWGGDWETIKDYPHIQIL
jgi:peptidoglycan L-alanyl-D-glutamate endopeptidase CwlK